MAEYTYADVIIDPEDPRVKIGAEYYFANHVKSVLSFANIDVGYSLSTLSAIEAKSDYPFVDSLGNMNAFIIRKKDPKKKYVPFDLSLEEDREKLRGAWLRHKESGNEYLIASIISEGHGEYSGWHVHLVKAGKRYPYQLLSEYEFVDGTPCGKVEEEE